MAAQAKQASRLADAGTLDEDDTALDVEAGRAVDVQLGHRWDNRRRPKRGPHIAKHAELLPTNAAELERCLRDPEWRLFSGCLYQIIVKGEPVKNDAGEIIDEGDSFVMPFKPNRAQRRFITRLWHRNAILKARQLGFTTLIAILWLDHALFNGNQRCGMIAQDRETAEAIFRDKVVFAYDHLPEEIRQRFPLARASTKELLFDHNNSSIRVATSLRGGTIQPSRIAKVFPKHRELILECGRHGQSWWVNLSPEALDGGGSTGLTTGAWDAARGWTVAEHNWYDPVSKDMSVAEVWYRRWAEATVLRSPDGRVVEYDADNPVHNYSLARGLVRPQHAVIPRVRRSFWLGPHRLHDGPSPYTHRHFPYVPFWGYREDGTRVPYGLVRGMIFQQDRLNSGTAAMTWGMTAYRVERTKGAVAMTDEQLRRQVGRRNADILLDPAHMAQPGARFEVKRDVQLTDQQLQMLNDARMALERVSPAAASAFSGRRGTATSGVQEDTQVQQANQGLAHLMDNFKAARSQVGELLLAMIVEDMGREPHTVVIEGDAITPDRTIFINKPETDPKTGVAYLSNDLQRTRLKVALEDVPSSPSYQGQQLNAMSEAVKSLPAQYQAAAMPFLASLMNVPFKRDLVEALRAAGQQASPEDIEKQIQERVAQEVKLAGHDLKARELDMRERLTDAQIKQVMAQAVQTGVQAAFAAMQGGAQVAQMPMIAPIADAIMQGAGYKRPTPGGDDPNFPTPAQTAAMNIKDPYIQGQGPALVAPEAQEEAGAAPPLRENTSPAFPARAGEGGQGMDGIETERTVDNLPAATP